MQKKNLNYRIIIIFVFSFLCGCKKDKYPLPVASNVKRTVLVFMEANNNLKYDAINSINSMEAGFVGAKQNLLVYIKTEDKVSFVLKIAHDNQLNKIKSDTVLVINSDSPSNPNILKQCIDFAKNNYPTESFGLILWSHATSWAPPADQIKLKSFGSDRGTEMDVFELRDALPDNLDFIIFDACSMGSIEVLYEFKGKAKFILSSPSETIAESYPYEKITPYLFGGLDSLKKVAQIYFDHYNAYTGNLRSATISLISTKELTGLTEKTRELISKKKDSTWIRDGIQRLDFSTGFPVPAFDIGDFFSRNFALSDLSDVNSKLNKTILYKANTPTFFGKLIKTYSGMSCFIPDPSDRNFGYYKRFAWYRDSGISMLYEK